MVSSFNHKKKFFFVRIALKSSLLFLRLLISSENIEGLRYKSMCPFWKKKFFLVGDRGGEVLSMLQSCFVDIFVVKRLFCDNLTYLFETLQLFKIVAIKTKKKKNVKINEKKKEKIFESLF